MPVAANLCLEAASYPTVQLLQTGKSNHRIEGFTERRPNGEKNTEWRHNFISDFLLITSKLLQIHIEKYILKATIFSSASFGFYLIEIH